MFYRYPNNFEHRKSNHCQNMFLFQQRLAFSLIITCPVSIFHVIFYYKGRLRSEKCVIVYVSFYPTNFYSSYIINIVKHQIVNQQISDFVVGLILKKRQLK